MLNITTRSTVMLSSSQSQNVYIFTETSILQWKSNSETPLERRNVFLHWGDVLDGAAWQRANCQTSTSIQCYDAVFDDAACVLGFWLSWHWGLERRRLGSRRAGGGAIHSEPHSFCPSSSSRQCSSASLASAFGFPPSCFAAGCSCYLTPSCREEPVCHAASSA